MTIASRSGHPVVRIVADDREGSSPVIEALTSMGGVELSVKRLEAGDYLVDNSLVVERKTHRDLVQSICDGRLFRQAWRLATCSAPRRCLVIETLFGRPDCRLLPAHTIQGAIITVSLLFGIPVLHSVGAAETAHLLLLAGCQLHRRHTGAPRAHPIAHGPARSTQVLMLLAVRNVGPAKAAALLDHFGSIRALATATVEDLATVPGIGSRTARNVHWALNAVQRQGGV